MRFVKILLCVALCLGLGACQKADTAKMPDMSKHSGNFETTANISYKDLKAVAVLSRESPRSCSVTFTSPENLTDMSFIFWKEKVELNYKGLSFAIDPNAMPGSMVADIAVGAINKAMQDNGLAVERTDGALIVTGVMQSGGFTLRLDDESGNLLKLSVPSEELEIEFLNFTFLD